MTKANFTNVANEDNLQWKTTYNGRLPQMEDFLPKKLYVGYVTKANFTNVSNKDDLQWKTTSNIKSEISQYCTQYSVLVGSSPNFTLKL